MKMLALAATLPGKSMIRSQLNLNLTETTTLWDALTKELINKSAHLAMQYLENIRNVLSRHNLKLQTQH